MEINPLDFIIAAIATWRLSYMVTKENGPFGVFLFARTKMGGALDCIYCLSVWVATVCTVLLYFNLALILYPFAISGLAMMLRSYTGAGMHDV